MKFQTVILLISISCSLERNQTIDTKEIIGIWQDSHEVASGWSDTYQFFENNEFIYRYNQMICDKRTLSYSGTWELAGERLKIKVSEKTVLEGGKLVPAMGSCGSEYEIEGGEIKTINYVRTYDMQLSSIIVDKENRDFRTMTFDSKRFWKLKDDPTKY